ncbi:hypothetical protein DFH09DRAFT_1067774 [Mycena vulgaris]|nr:hypothetical protein DFH09DRAFT_1067774 [Mycena vulgaris]
MASVSPTPIKCHEAAAMALARSVIAVSMIHIERAAAMPATLSALRRAYSGIQEWMLQRCRDGRGCSVTSDLRILLEVPSRRNEIPCESGCDVEAWLINESIKEWKTAPELTVREGLRGKSKQDGMHMQRLGKSPASWHMRHPMRGGGACHINLGHGEVPPIVPISGECDSGV